MALPAGVSMAEVEWEPRPRRLTQVEREVIDYLAKHPETAAKVTLEEAVRFRKARDLARRRAKEEAMRRRWALKLARFRAEEQVRQAELAIPEPFRKTRIQRAKRVAKNLRIPLLQAIWIVNEFYENWNLADALAERQVQQLKRGRK